MWQSCCLRIEPRFRFRKESLPLFMLDGCGYWYGGCCRFGGGWGIWCGGGACGCCCSTEGGTRPGLPCPGGLAMMPPNRLLGPWPIAGGWGWETPVWVCNPLIPTWDGWPPRTSSSWRSRAISSSYLWPAFSKARHDGPLCF